MYSYVAILASYTLHTAIYITVSLASPLQVATVNLSNQIRQICVAKCAQPNLLTYL